MVNAQNITRIIIIYIVTDEMRLQTFLITTQHNDWMIRLLGERSVFPCNSFTRRYRIQVRTRLHSVVTSRVATDAFCYRLVVPSDHPETMWPDKRTANYTLNTYLGTDQPLRQPLYLATVTGRSWSTIESRRTSGADSSAFDKTTLTLRKLYDKKYIPAYRYYTNLDFHRIGIFHYLP